MGKTKKPVELKPGGGEPPLYELDDAELDAVMGGTNVPPFGGGTFGGGGAGGTWLMDPTRQY